MPGWSHSSWLSKCDLRSDSAAGRSARRKRRTASWGRLFPYCARNPHEDAPHTHTHQYLLCAVACGSALPHEKPPESHANDDANTPTDLVAWHTGRADLSSEPLACGFEQRDDETTQSPPIQQRASADQAGIDARPAWQRTGPALDRDGPFARSTRRERDIRRRDGGTPNAASLTEQENVV